MIEILWNIINGIKDLTKEFGKFYLKQRTLHDFENS